MRIGIVPVLGHQGGGIYQYSLTMIRTLHECEWGGGDEFVIFANYHDMKQPIAGALSEQGWTVRLLYPQSPPSLGERGLNALRRVVGEGPHRKAWRSLRRCWQEHTKPKSEVRNPKSETRNLPDPDGVRWQPVARRWLRWQGIDLMLYPAPAALSFEAGIPYVMAIHDLQHRLQPEFPEVSANGEWESREYLFRNGARYATLLLADSEVGKEDILNFYGPYGVTPDRVKVLPFIPACYLAVDVTEDEQRRVRATYRLPERYLFYPAQFWPHKNHARIVQALGLLKQSQRLSIPIVFCGSHSGEIRERAFQEMMSVAHELGVAEQIHYLGYVPDEDMSAVYAGAVALVMPTFFGPTNIPVLEAWAFGCPVLTSDIRGIREQAGDAAVLADPRSVEAIADGIYRLWTDDGLRRLLTERGRQRLSAYTPDDFRRRLIDIIEEAKMRVRSEKPRMVVR